MHDLGNERRSEIAQVNFPDLSLEISQKIQKIQKMQLVFPIQSCWSSGSMGCNDDERFGTLPQRHVCIRKLSSIHRISIFWTIKHKQIVVAVTPFHCGKKRNYCFSA